MGCYVEAILGKSDSFVVNESSPFHLPSLEHFQHEMTRMVTKYWLHVEKKYL
jgi:hypothetical protein